jgi:glycosyltransferase involved in cell wall biosynthesis
MVGVYLYIINIAIAKDFINNGQSDMESNNLNLSVIIPTHNRAGMICRAINSVIPQLTVDDEIIVIDDGSTDGTEESLNKVRDRIIYRRISQGGAGRARNEGIKIAHNGLIAFLDSDDEWMPKKIELQRAVLRARPDVLFCVSNLACTSSSGSEHHQVFSWLYKDEFGEHLLGPGAPFSSIAPLPEGMDDFMVHIGDLYEKEMERELVSVITLMYRRGSKHERDLIFPEDLPTREEWEFVGKLARKGLAAYLDCETAIVHRHDSPALIKLDHLDPFAFLNARMQVLERVWGADTVFLKDHREEYLMVKHEVHKSFIREFLRLGRTEEAREEIRKNMNIPMTYKLLSRFPGFVNRSFFHSRFLWIRKKLGLPL